MSDPAAPYSLPTWASNRWLTDAGSSIPLAIRSRLVGNFFTTPKPIVFGAMANTAGNVVAVVLYPTTLFFTLLAVDLLVVVCRLTILALGHRAAAQGRATPTDLFMLSGILWAGVVGVGTALCVASGDPCLQFLAPTTMMGIVSGIATRNNCAPRFTIAQAALCDVPMQVVLPFTGHHCMLVSVGLCPLFLLGMAGNVYRLNRSYLAAVMAESDSERRATHDSLTGALNRAGLLASLSRDLLAALPIRAPLALLYMDLDGFKNVNDRLGHAAGDDLLCQVTGRFMHLLPEHCRLGRFGGDEFVVVARGYGASDAVSLAERMIAAAGHRFVLSSGAEAEIGLSIGVACAGTNATVDTLLNVADEALYRAKTGGKGRCILAADQDSAGRRAA